MNVMKIQWGTDGEPKTAIVTNLKAEVIPASIEEGCDVTETFVTIDSGSVVTFEPMQPFPDEMKRPDRIIFCGVEYWRVAQSTDPIIERESFDEVPVVSVGGFLQIKNGKLCLRLSDMIQKVGKKYILQRTWKPPGEQPFDTSIYPVKS